MPKNIALGPDFSNWIPHTPRHTWILAKESGLDNPLRISFVGLSSNRLQYGRPGPIMTEIMTDESEFKRLGRCCPPTGNTSIRKDLCIYDLSRRLIAGRISTLLIPLKEKKL